MYDFIFASEYALASSSTFISILFNCFATVHNLISKKIRTSGMFYVRKQWKLTIVNSQIKIRFISYKVQLCTQRWSQKTCTGTLFLMKQKEPNLHNCITFVHFMTPLQHFTLSPHTTSVVHKCAQIEIPTNLKLSNPRLIFHFQERYKQEREFQLL